MVVVLVDDRGVGRVGRGRGRGSGGRGGGGGGEGGYRGKAAEEEAGRDAITAIRRRGRPRTVGQDPETVIAEAAGTTTAIIPTMPRLHPSSTSSSARSSSSRSSSSRSSSSSSHPPHPLPPPPPPASPLDAYFDADYLRAERARRYRLDDFNVAIKNDHDHDEEVRFRVHPILKSAVKALYESKEFPFASEQAIWRVGALELLRRCHYLAWAGKRKQYLEEERTERAGVGTAGTAGTAGTVGHLQGHDLDADMPCYVPPNWMAVLDACTEIITEEEQMMGFQRSLSELQFNVDRLRKQYGEFGDVRAVQLIARVRAEVRRLGDTEWGRWYLGQIDGEYGELLEGEGKRVKVKRR